MNKKQEVRQYKKDKFGPIYTMADQINFDKLVLEMNVKSTLDCGDYVLVVFEGE